MVENLNDLKKLLVLLRKQGITSFECKDLKLTLGDLPQEHQAVHQPEETQDPLAGFPTDRILTNEELAYWSAGGPQQDEEQTSQ